MSVRAADNPAQAAARAVLEQKLNQPDAWEPQSAHAGYEHTSRGRGETTREIRDQWQPVQFPKKRSLRKPPRWQQRWRLRQWLPKLRLLSLLRR